MLLLSLVLPKRLRQYDLNMASYRVYTLVRGVRRLADRPRVGVMFFGKYPPRDFQARPWGRYLMPSDSMERTVPQGLRVTEADAATNHEAAEPAPPAPAQAATAGDADESAASVPDPEAAPPAESHPLPAVAASVGPAEAPDAPASPAQTADPEFRPAREERRKAPRADIFVNFTIEQVDEWGSVLQEELTVADNLSPGGARILTSLGLHVGDVLLLREAGGAFATRAEVRAITRVQPAVDRLHLRFMDGPAPDRLTR